MDKQLPLYNGYIYNRKFNIGRVYGTRAPGGEWSGATPPKVEGLSAFCVSKASRTFAPWLIFDKVIKSHSERKIHCLTTHLQVTPTMSTTVTSKFSK